MNSGRTVDEIEDKFKKLRKAHPDYLQLDGENDEIISRLSRLKPVEPDEPDPDIEFLKKEEELGPVQTSCFCRAELNSGIKFGRSTASESNF